MVDKDIIAGWLVKHGKTTSEYMLRLKRDGEVFLGPNGFIEPEDISAVNVEDLESEEISLDDIEARGVSPIKPTLDDFYKMSEAGLRGAAAGRKLKEIMGKSYAEAKEKINQRFLDNAAKYLKNNSMENIIRAVDEDHSVGEDMVIVFKSENKSRWYKPWTWEFFRMLGKPKVMKIETVFSAGGGTKIDESEEDYRKRLLAGIRYPDKYEIAEDALKSAMTWNRNINDFTPLGSCIELSKSECIKLAERYPFSLDDIKQIFWDGRP